MSVYKYSQGSVVDEVTFIKSDGGSTRAYLHALPDTSEKTLGDISLAMAKRGWQTVPNSMNGKATLEIRGFSRTSQINDMISENGWAKGKPQITEDKKDNSRFWDKLRNRSLFLSGISFMISDACYTVYGKKDKSPLNAAAGLAYMAGGVASTVFARKDTPDLEIKEIAGRMANYMQAQKIELPDDCALNSIIKDKHKGLIKSTDDLFRRYPAELSNTLIGLAGALIATDAIKELRSKTATAHNKSVAPIEIALGATTMASALFGNLVEEKAHDPDAPRKHGLPGVWEWIQERPLMVTGIGYLVSSGFHIASTVKDYKGGDSEKRTAAKWRMGFIGWTVLGEILIAISSKGHGKGVISDKSVSDSVVSLAADLIAKQPPAKHDYLIDYMSGFLGRDDVLARKDTDVKDLLRTQVELVKKNPWARCKENLPADLPAPKNQIFTPATDQTHWQQVVQQAAQNPSPAIFI